ncbi:hypothetical protein JOD82_002049 [Paenibacillus sp. 1182]|uniref:hypothetical protein n=1 Tax=Paenibacillus sp. 1182 TaxID=2806565 RepID=UPI001AE9664C|nr:hypothetical protein [Paenibacillus sp. 1182]MBP1309029.1 hypothetical protein [Paenibacillus sp. 1182]
MELTMRQIMDMEPSCKMDAHVGKLVVNDAPEIKWWVVNEEETVIFKDCNYKSEAEEWLDELAAMHEDHGIKIVRKELFRNYSGSMSAAWEVEENLLLKHPGVQTRYLWRLRLVTGWVDKQPAFREDFKLIHATPEERCKAALLAVLNL